MITVTLSACAEGLTIYAFHMYAWAEITADMLQKLGSQMQLGHFTVLLGVNANLSVL